MAINKYIVFFQMVLIG